MLKDKKILIVSSIVAFFVFFIVGIRIASLMSDFPLRSCFDKRGIEWTNKNRASEAAKIGIWQWKDTRSQKKGLFEQMGCSGFGFTVATDYQKTLSSPMTSSQSFVPVTSLTLKDGNILSMSTLGSVVFLTLEPGATNEEIAACTTIDSVNKQFTGCTRGLAFSGTSTAPVAANQKTHSSGATVVMSNVHYVYQQFIDKDGTTQYVTSTVVFNTFPQASSTTAIPSSASQLATKYYVDTVGAGGFTSNNVSSTLGLQAILSGIPNCPSGAACVGINASSSGGLSFYPGTGAAYVSVSSTPSDSLGGYLKYAFNVANQIYWDAASFLSRDHTWSGNQTFNGNVALNSSSSNTTDIVNYGTVINSTATGTAGETIAYGQPLYVSTTGTLFLTSANFVTSSYPFVGIALGAATNGQTVSYARPGGIVGGLTGISPNLSVYLSNTTGTISTSKGSVPVKIGLSLNSTTMLVLMPIKHHVITGTVSVTFNGSTVAVINTNWKPNKVTLHGAIPAGNNFISNGYAILNSDGSTSQTCVGSKPGIAGSIQWESSNSVALCGQDTSNNDYATTLAFTSTGFTLTPSSVSGNPSQTINYTAEYIDE